MDFEGQIYVLTRVFQRRMLLFESECMVMGGSLGTVLGQKEGIILGLKELALSV